MSKRKRRIGVAIDMTPMVDVAFLLLIFFMTTTTFKPPDEVTIDLPVSHAEYKVPESDVLVLTIAKDSRLFARTSSQEPMMQIEMGQVSGLVKGERTKNSRLRVIVRADRECSYGTMEDMMNILQEARTNRFVLMTEGEGSGNEKKELPADQGALETNAWREVAFAARAEGEPWAR